MAQHPPIGIIYHQDYNWVGGTYYIQNLIRSLLTLPAAEQPELVIYSDSPATVEKLASDTGFAQMRFHPSHAAYSLPERVINKAGRMLLGKNLIEKSPELPTPLVFPNPMGSYFGALRRKVFWIPDFQHNRLPQFFQQEEIQQRDAWHRLPVDGNHPLVLSSEAAAADFHHFYPEASNPLYVIPFAVTLPPLGGIKEEDAVLDKFDARRPFFLCSNQFWAHKNHPLVLDALSRLRERHPDTLVLFTGKEYDYRNPDYTDQLKQRVADEGLGDMVRFLGFIGREEQLILMKRALAVIQPSMFEGWSTVIEDAKALNQRVFASALDVNKEQLASYPASLQAFFDIHDADALAALMADATVQDDRPEYDYQKDIAAFGASFMNMVHDLV